MTIAAFRFVWHCFRRARDTSILTSLYTFNQCGHFGVFYRQNNFVCDASLQGSTERSDKVIDHKIAENTSFLKN